MKKKSIVPRILILLPAYALVFLVIAAVQFRGRQQDPDVAETGLNPGENVFNPGEFLVPRANTAREFDAAVSRWRGDNFILWNRIIPEQNDENLVTAFAGEALSRSAYNAAVSIIPRGFLNGNQRTHVSSVYLGQLDAAYQSLIASDRERLTRLARLVPDKSPDILRGNPGETGTVDFLASRGNTGQAEEIAALVNGLAPETLSPEHVPGIFEGFTAWKRFRADGENPFSRLIEYGTTFISESVLMNGEKTRVFVVNNGSINVEFNLSLGKALLDWAELEKNEPWTILARSIILSVFSLENNGTVKAEYTLTPDGGVSENSEAALSTARMYRILGYGEFNPRAVALAAPEAATWVWTAAQSVNAVMENNIVDISVTFPAGETHYLIISGIPPFAKIQLYNMDFRTDPQFERYDSSGWSYVAGERILLVKMKHRAGTEHIRIFYN